MTKKILLLILLLLWSKPAFAVTNWCEDVNIRGCYTFEGDAANSLLDVSSNDNDLFNNNSVSFISGAKCFDGSNCYEYDGTSNRMLNDNSDDFNITSGDITVVAYIYPDTFGENSFGRIVDYSGTNIGWSLYVNNGSLTNGITATSIGNSSVIDSGNNDISTGQLNHVAFTKTGNDGIIYVDGVSEGTNASFADFDSATGEDFRIGLRDDAQREFDGGIDEVAVFGALLDSTDINSIMIFGLVQAGEEPPAAGGQLILVN